MYATAFTGTSSFAVKARGSRGPGVECLPLQVEVSSESSQAPERLRGGGLSLHVLYFCHELVDSLFLFLSFDNCDRSDEDEEKRRKKGKGKR